MKVLMISLDGNILQDNSEPNRRIGKWADFVGKLIVLVSAEKRLSVELNKNVFLMGSGGLIKPLQFFQLIIQGINFSKKEKFDCVTSQDPFYAGLVAFIISWWTGTPLHIQVHGSFFGNNYWLNESFFNPFRLLLARFILNRASAIRTVSDSIKEDIIQFGITAKNITVAPVFVDLLRFFKIWKNRLGTFFSVDWNEVIKARGGVKLLYLGRLEKGKNLETILLALKDVARTRKDFVFNIVGDGSQKNHLKKLSLKLGLSGIVKFFDYTRSPEKFYEEADCFVFPSLHESFGAAPLEAVASGCFLLTTKVGWMRGIDNGDAKIKGGIKCVSDAFFVKEWADSIIDFLDKGYNPLEMALVSETIYPYSEKDIYYLQKKSWEDATAYIKRGHL